jgi:hypothetical protein
MKHTPAPWHSDGVLMTPFEHEWRWYWWKFVHNGLIHPLLALPFEPEWAQRAHDWTARRCIGGG